MNPGVPALKQTVRPPLIKPSTCRKSLANITHNVVSRIGIGSCKSNYRTITTTTVPICIAHFVL